MLRIRAALVTLLSVTAVTLVAQGPGAGRGGGQPVQPIQPIKKDLYVVPGGGANSVVRVTPAGVILVDTKMPGEQNYRDLVAQIATVTTQPVKLAIVTHHHADHTGNDAAFLAAGAAVIGQRNLATNLTTYQFDPRPAPPSITYDDAYTARLGGAEARVLHIAAGHTSGDSIVYFPDAKVVVTSDLIATGGTGPLVDYAGGGSALQWLRALDGMLALDFDAAVPGNGPVLTKADVQAFATRFRTMIDRAREQVRNGVAPDKLLSSIRTDDLGWTPRVPLVEQFAAELRQGSAPR